MTEAERKAMHWLESRAMGWRDTEQAAPLAGEHASVIKRMLARPVLPEPANGDPDYHAALRVIGAECGPSLAGHVYRALYAHLTAPKTKEVWVECWGVLTEAGVAGSYFDERSARNDTMVKEGAGHVVRLTGRATVPA